jgi:sec-independent protein translocase protein TatA
MEVHVMGVGTQELMIILLVVLILFGGAKIPEFAKGMGKAIREFKKASQGEDEEEEKRPAKPKKVNPD